MPPTRLGALALVLGVTSLAAAAPTGCPGGRFLLAAGAGAGGTAVIEDGVEIGPGAVLSSVECGETTAQIRPRRDATRVRARWKRCGTLRNLRFTARILAPDCTHMIGKLRARGTRPEPFAARRSTCGDGRFDPVAEACEAGVGCLPTEGCTHECTCVPADGGPGPTGPTTTTTTLPPAGCTVTQLPYAGGVHLSEGSRIDYVDNPPASGPHYPVWARYQAYPVPLARGYWVHNLEHGAIVLVYRPDAHSDVVAALQAAWDAIPNDDRCPHKRALMTPDPELDTPFAVVAANHVLDCDRVDVPTIVDFVVRRRNHGLEDNCLQGVVGSPTTTTTMLPAPSGG